MEISLTALWKKWLIFCSRITPISLIFKNILYKLTLKTLSTRPRSQDSVSPAANHIPQECRWGRSLQRLPAPPTQPLVINQQIFGKHGADAHTHCLVYRYLLSTSLSQPCVRRWLCPGLLPLALCDAGRESAVHLLFRKILNKLEYCNELPTPCFLEAKAH